MNIWINKFPLWLLLLILMTCKAQNNTNTKLLGGPCEGCEGIFEFGNKKLQPVDTLPDFHRYKPNLKITGTIYLPDQKTPAPDVVLYIYHTNPAGEYALRGNETGWGKRHGYIRGWVKTNKDGKYTFYTHKPGSYGTNPAHIHPTILEPNGSYYYIDEFHFESDPLLREEPGKNPYGGNGTVQLKKINDSLYLAKRDIILGLNIPDYE